MSRDEYARHRGVTPQRISACIADGMPCQREEGKQGGPARVLIDAAKADKWMEEYGRAPGLGRGGRRAGAGRKRATRAERRRASRAKPPAPPPAPDADQDPVHAAPAAHAPAAIGLGADGKPLGESQIRLLTRGQLMKLRLVEEILLATLERQEREGKLVELAAATEAIKRAAAESARLLSLAGRAAALRLINEAGLPAEKREQARLIIDDEVRRAALRLEIDLAAACGVEDSADEEDE